MRRLIMLMVLALSVLSLSAQDATAKEVYHGYVKDEYYLIRGGTPATFEEVDSNPMKVFRSQVAYDSLRAHIGTYLNKTLTDADFRSLMLSDDVRLVPCEGKIDTSGVTDSGRTDWHLRNCYAKEKLIELRLPDGRWVVVASQGCYNPVRGRVPSLPPVVQLPPPPVFVTKCYMVPQEEAEVFQAQGFIPSVYIAACCNGGGTCSSQFIPGMVYRPGYVDADPTLIRICLPERKE